MIEISKDEFDFVNICIWFAERYIFFQKRIQFRLKKKDCHKTFVKPKLKYRLY